MSCSGHGFLILNDTQLIEPSVTVFQVILNTISLQKMILITVLVRQISELPTKIAKALNFRVIYPKTEVLPSDAEGRNKKNQFC